MRKWKPKLNESVANGFSHCARKIPNSKREPPALRPDLPRREAEQQPNRPDTRTNELRNISREGFLEM